MEKVTSTSSRLRKGDRLQDGVLHTQQHGRRGFLRTLGVLGASGFLLNQLPVSALAPTPLSAALADGNDERVLVFVRLKGGNDGLNTFIPLHDYGNYAALRPTLKIERSQAVSLTAELAVHPQLAPLQSLWNNDRMRVVRNVGYPDHSLSHFRSSDIMASGSDADENVTSGVLGRYLTSQYPDFLSAPPQTPPAIQIGGPGNLLFNNADDFNYAISTQNPRQLYDIASSGQLYDVSTVPDCTYGEQLGYLRAVANTTFKYAGVLAEAFDAGRNTSEYTNDRLGDQLALVARLLRGGLKTRLFVVEQDGYDTHANQEMAHATLLNSLATNMKAFYDDLGAGDIEQRVLSVTFSEFGRRVFENGSKGTDHGTAAPMMLFGPGLNGSGVSGDLPDLQQVDERGNLIHTLDYRAVYATVLADWLCIEDSLVDQILGSTYPRVSTLGLRCQATTSTNRSAAADQLTLNVYLSGGTLALDYELPASSKVRIHCFDASGRKISTPYAGQRTAGNQTQRIPLHSIGYAAGVYVVSLEVNGRMYSRKVGYFRQ